MNERELRLLRGIRDSLVAIQQEIHSIRDQQEQWHRHQQVIDERPADLPVVLAELQVPEHIQRENRTDTKKNRSIQLWLTVGTWLAFIAASVYAGIAYRQKEAMIAQWKTMDLQRQAMADALKQTQEQTTLMRQQLKATQSAIVNFLLDLTTESEKFKLVFNADNRGHGIANNVTATCLITIKTWPQRKQVGREISLVAIYPQPLSPPDDRFGEHSIRRTIDIPGISNSDWQIIGRGERFISVEWEASYENGFGDTIKFPRTVGCVQYLAPLSWEGGGFSTGSIRENCGENFDVGMRDIIKARQKLEAEHPPKKR